jgi:hypothetical protein
VSRGARKTQRKVQGQQRKPRLPQFPRPSLMRRRPLLSRLLPVAGCMEL